jgi:hypothetical protein
MGKKKKDEQKRFYLNKYFELKKDFLEFEEIIVSKFQYFSLEDVLKYKSRLNRLDNSMHKLIKQLKKHHKIYLDIENRNLKIKDFINE